MKSGIYQIVGPDRVYFGQAQDVYKRFNAHRNLLRRDKHVNTHLQNAWNKYGEYAFTFEPLVFVPVEELSAYEQVALDSRDAKDKYNVAVDAECPPRGWKRSDESKNKMRAAQTGRKASDATKAKMRAARVGRTLSEETKKKIGAANKGKQRSEAVKDNLRGRKHTDEAKVRMSIAQSGKKISEECKLKMSIAHKGIRHSAEHRAKLSASHKALRQRQREQQ